MANRGLHYLVSGIPAAGKSHLCRWLAAAHGFRHIDFDAGVDVRHQLHALYEQQTLGAETPELLESVERLVGESLSPDGTPLALEWGFHTVYVPTIALLKRAGFTTLWCNADHAQARAAYIRRDGAGAAEAFDAQLDRIRVMWSKIEPIFAPNIIITLESDGTRMPPEEIARRMGIGTLE